MSPGSRFRMTRQRQVILEELRKVTTHPTADEVYLMVRRRLPRISLGTVYRNLEMLSECGLVLKLELGGTQRRFDGNVATAHYHVRCVRCGRVDDVPGVPIPGIADVLSDLTDYEILKHRLDFTGVCPDCKKLELDAERAEAGKPGAKPPSRKSRSAKRG